MNRNDKNSKEQLELRDHLDCMISMYLIDSIVEKKNPDGTIEMLVVLRN